MRIANPIYDTVFKYRMEDNRHFLEIDEAEVPERYRPILRRLQRAVAEPEVAEAMELEDEVLEELQSLEREVEKERAEKEKAIADKEKERKEKERLLSLLKQAGVEP
jgi:hypothetical protein